jgi:hypothetical protein
MLDLPVIDHVDTSLAACPITFQLFGYFTDKQLWEKYDDCGNCLDYIVTDFDPVTGQVKIQNADGT